MAHSVYICDACGFQSREEMGVYQCPKCGNQMRIAQETRGGDNTVTSGIIIIYIIEVFFVLPLCVGILNVFGIPIFIIIIWLTRRHFKNRFNDKAIRIR